MGEIEAVGQHQRAIGSSNASLNEAVSCKIPLLDGDHGTQSRPIAVQTVLEQTQNLQQIYVEDRALFEAIINNAWGLVLRCFTGQEHVGFFVKKDVAGSDSRRSASNNERDQLGFQFTFDQQQPLLTHITKAKTEITSLERKSNAQGPQSDKLQSISSGHQINTTVRIEGSGFSRSAASRSDSSYLAEDSVLQVGLSYPKCSI